MSNHTIDHPTLGNVRGIRKSATVTQYLGVQYATLKDRFARGELVQARKGEGVLDATKHGPIPLSPPNACELEHEMIQKSLPFAKFEQSDTQCLTLNISVPHLRSDTDLSVLAFVHGGGFMTGSSSFPQYDLALITEMSVEIGTPMICVGINYRTGAAGFLYSSAMAEQGYKPNNGLDDQRLALRWIKHNIAGFGGDSGKVTFVGESAGAVSGWFHLQSAEPLFDQFVAMSGSSFLRPRPLQLLEKSFNVAATELGTRDTVPEKQLQKLLGISNEDFVAKIGRNVPVGPVMDGDLISCTSTFQELVDKPKLEDMFPAIKNCRRIIMGDCQMDGMGFWNRVKTRSDVLPQTLANCLSSVLDGVDIKLTPSIVSAYGLDLSAESNTPETTKAVLDFAADVSFALPARYLARAWSSSSIPGVKAFLYHFNCPNPWEGLWKGYAIHALDIMFVLQNYREYLSLGQRHCSETFARHLIAFVCGEDPWAAYGTKSKPGSMVYYASIEGESDQSAFVPDESPEKTGRKNILLKLVGEALLDRLVEACQMLLIGPS